MLTKLRQVIFPDVVDRDAFIDSNFPGRVATDVPGFYRIKHGATLGVFCGEVTVYPPKKPVCARCGSDALLFDAYVKFNSALGIHEIVNVFDNVVCESDQCQGTETSASWIDCSEELAQQS